MNGYGRSTGPDVVARPAGRRWLLAGPEAQLTRAHLGLPRLSVDPRQLDDVAAYCQAHRLLLVVARRPA